MGIVAKASPCWILPYCVTFPSPNLSFLSCSFKDLDKIIPGGLDASEFDNSWAKVEGGC